MRRSRSVLCPEQAVSSGVYIASKQARQWVEQACPSYKGMQTSMGRPPELYNSCAFVCSGSLRAQLIRRLVLDSKTHQDCTEGLLCLHWRLATALVVLLSTRWEVNGTHCAERRCFEMKASNLM